MIKIKHSIQYVQINKSNINKMKLVHILTKPRIPIDRFIQPFIKDRLKCPLSTLSTLNINTIPKLLEVFKEKDDLKSYLNNYTKQHTRKTAIIKIGGEVIEKELNNLIQSISFLRDCGLFPIIIHGAGPQMNKELEKKKIEPKYESGMRVTDVDTLSIAHSVFIKANIKLVNAMNLLGLPCRPITTGVFEAITKDIKKYGYVGDITKIHDESIHAAILCDQVPILSCLGQSHDGQLLNINADVAARELALKFRPYKTIFINSKGGWIDDDGKKLKIINMATDYKKMASRDYTGRQGTLLKLNEIKLLLDNLPSSSSVVLTSASDLYKEISDKHGSGTVCIRGDDGYKSLIHNNIGTNKKKYKVALLGARGYVGREVINIIGNHEELELVCASSRALEGQNVYNYAMTPPTNPHTNETVISKKKDHNSNMNTSLDIDPNLVFCNLLKEDIPTSSIAKNIDIWILALPNGYCNDYATAISKINTKNKNQIIIDLSADQRFNKKWTYGLPEFPGNREKIRKARLISNPGCYATGSQIGLLPLLMDKKGNQKAGILDMNTSPYIFGVSGYSGAGTGLSNMNNVSVLNNNIIAYKSLNHIHEKEISYQLGKNVNFLPHVAPYFHGIHLTISAKLKNDQMIDLDNNNIIKLYEDFYKNENLISIVGNKMPWVKDIAGENNIVLGGIQVDNETKRLVIISTIDNLLKGAATQAIQNINLALDLDEMTGISI